MSSVSITDFGAKGDGHTDNSAAIQAALDFAKTNGLDVLVPAGVFAHSSTLSISGIHVSGTGDGSVLKATHYGQEALYLRGDGADLSDLRIESVNGARLSTDASAQVLVDGAINFAVENIHIVGSSSAGIQVNTGAYGTIADNLIENTRADSIHMVSGSHDIVVENNRTVGSGDDGISVVSYQGAGTVHNITVSDNEVLDNTGGRGVAVVGGSEVVIEHNTVESSASNAGIYIAAEQAYNTEAVHDVQVTDNTVIDAGGPTSGHGAITLYNSQGGQGLTNDGITIADNDIIDPRFVGIAVRGTGIQTAAIYDNQVSGGETALDISAGAQLNLVSPADVPDVAGADPPDTTIGIVGVAHPTPDDPLS